MEVKKELSKEKEAPTKARKIYEEIVKAFEKLSISPTPLNYYIWYHYIKKENTEFCQEMDTALNNKMGYTDRLGRRLYDEYLNNDDAKNQFDLSFQRIINSILSKVNSLNSQLAEQSNDLSDASNNLSGSNLTQANLQNIAESLIKTADSMKASSSDFQSEVLESQDEITQLKEELKKAKAELLTDELTQIGNRKHFNNTMLELTESTKDSPENLHLVIADIDFFKRFNDSFGHQIGDSVLRYFAGIMKKGEQPNEVISRYGGEEFAILIHSSNKDAVIKRAEQIRVQLQGSKLKLKDSSQDIGKITSSFGISTYKGVKDSIESFIERADKALYLAKEKGRNQVKYETDLLTA